MMIDIDNDVLWALWPTAYTAVTAAAAEDGKQG